MIRSQPWPDTCIDCGACDRVEWSILDHTAIADLAPARRPRVYKAGQTIFGQQDDSQGIYCIESGVVLLHYIHVNGTSTVFTIIYEGNTVGWRSFFAREPHSASCVALTDCKICLIPSPKVEQMIQDSPALARAFLETVARDRGPREAMLFRGSGLSARDRLLNLLMVLKEHCVVAAQGEHLELKLPIKRQTMAAMLGIRGETLSRCIRELEAEGLARFDGTKVILPDFRKFKNQARSF